MNQTPDKDREKNERLLRLLEAATAERTDLAPRDEGYVQHGEQDQSHLAERDEYAALRAAWLAFGRLLDTATETQAIGGRSASERIKTQSASEKSRPFPRSRTERVPPLLPQKSRRLRRFAVIAAACGILLAIGILGLKWWPARGGGQIDRGPEVVRQNPPQPAATQVPVQQPPTVVHNDAQVVQNKATKPKQSTPTAKASTWDDAIDAEITSVSQQIESVRQTWGHRVDDADLVQYRIDEVSAGLTNDPL